MKVILIYVLGWVGLVTIAILNGALRVGTYGLFMNELAAHQVSTAIGLCLFGVYIWFLSRIVKLASARQAWLVGVMWLFMTVIFEFLFGHYVVGHSWVKLLYDYNLFEGRVWLLVVIWTAVAPYVFYRIRS